MCQGTGSETLSPGLAQSLGRTADRGVLGEPEEPKSARLVFLQEWARHSCQPEHVGGLHCPWKAVAEAGPAGPGPKA